MKVDREREWICQVAYTIEYIDLDIVQLIQAILLEGYTVKTFRESREAQRHIVELNNPDCASIIDHHIGKPYPQTAQHAIRQGKVVARNIISTINQKTNDKVKFTYKTKGMMADIGKRSGVAIIFGIKIGWWLWRSYYLANVPNSSKRVEVMIDWTIHLFFKRDVAIVKRVPRDTSRELECGLCHERVVPLVCLVKADMIYCCKIFCCDHPRWRILPIKGISRIPNALVKSIRIGIDNTIFFVRKWLWTIVVRYWWVVLAIFIISQIVNPLIKY